MRLTINFNDHLYPVAKSLGADNDHSKSQVVNKLIRRGLAPQSRPRRRKRNGLSVVHCASTFTSDDVYEHESGKA